MCCLHEVLLMQPCLRWRCNCSNDGYFTEGGPLPKQWNNRHFCPPPVWASGPKVLPVQQATLQQQCSNTTTYSSNMGKFYYFILYNIRNNLFLLFILHQMDQTKSLIETGRLVKIITAATRENKLFSVLVRLVETFSKVLLKYILMETNFEIIPLPIHMRNIIFFISQNVVKRKHFSTVSGIKFICILMQMEHLSRWSAWDKIIYMRHLAPLATEIVGHTGNLHHIFVLSFRSTNHFLVEERQRLQTSPQISLTWGRGRESDFIPPRSSQIGKYTILTMRL